MTPATSKTSPATRGSRGIPRMGEMPRSTRTFEMSLTRIASHLALVTHSTLTSLRSL
jgi:hypothetical protein